MGSLPLPVQAAVVLSFDFDGTLHDPSAQPPVRADFFALIQRLRTEQDAVWGINTGRSLTQMLDGFDESEFPFLPDFIVAREREIYFSTLQGQWVGHEKWNDRCETEIRRLFENCEKLLSHIRRDIESHTGARWIELSGEPAGIISRTDEEMDWIQERILDLASGEPWLGWQRNSIYLRFGHRAFQKGSSLSEVASCFSVPKSASFAIGDSHNDFEMLDPNHAGMIACPANAVDVIKEKVSKCGGFLAGSDHATGAIEALRHFFLNPNR